MIMCRMANTKISIQMVMTFLVLLFVIIDGMLHVDSRTILEVGFSFSKRGILLDVPLSQAKWHLLCWRQPTEGEESHITFRYAILWLPQLDLILC